MDNLTSIPSVLPMVTVIEYLILLMIATGSIHGYGIMQRISTLTAEQTDDEIRLRPGTLYGALKKLLDRGWIEESDPIPVPELDNERRRLYQLTVAGREILEQEIRRRDFLNNMGREILGEECREYGVGSD